MQAIIFKVLNGPFEKDLCSQNSCEFYFSESVVRGCTNVGSYALKKAEVNRM